MNSHEKFIANFQRVAHRLVEEQEWPYLSEIANFLQSFDRGNWSSLPYDEQLYWLNIMIDILGVHGLYDHWGCNDAVLNELVDYLHQYERAIKNKI